MSHEENTNNFACSVEVGQIAMKQIGTQVICYIAETGEIISIYDIPNDRNVTE